MCQFWRDINIQTIADVFFEVVSQNDWNHLCQSKRDLNKKSFCEIIQWLWDLGIKYQHKPCQILKRDRFEGFNSAICHLSVCSLSVTLVLENRCGSLRKWNTKKSFVVMECDFPLMVIFARCPLPSCINRSGLQSALWQGISTYIYLQRIGLNMLHYHQGFQNSKCVLSS